MQSIYATPPTLRGLIQAGLQITDKLAQASPLRLEGTILLCTQPGGRGGPVSLISAASPVSVSLVRHGRWRLRLGMQLDELQNLLNEHSSWATGRSRLGLATMLWGSSAVVSAWQAGRMVGFGRATSDGAYRAVLWDVVVAQPFRGRGLGRSIVSELLASPSVMKAEKVYLMTTNSDGFYRKLGFNENHGQKLLVRR